MNRYVHNTCIFHYLKLMASHKFSSAGDITFHNQSKFHSVMIFHLFNKDLIDARGVCKTISNVIACWCSSDLISDPKKAYHRNTSMPATFEITPTSSCKPPRACNTDIILFFFQSGLIDELQRKVKCVTPKKRSNINLIHIHCFISKTPCICL